MYIFIVAEPNSDDEQIESIKQIKVSYHKKEYAFGKIPRNRSRREIFPTDLDILISRIVDRSIRTQIPFINKRLEINVMVVDYGQEDVFVASALAANIAVKALLGEHYTLNLPTKVISSKDGFLINLKNHHHKQIYSILFSVNREGTDMVELTTGTSISPIHLKNEISPIYQKAEEALLIIEKKIQDISHKYQIIKDENVINPNNYSKHVDSLYPEILKEIISNEYNGGRKLTSKLKKLLLEKLFIGLDIPNQHQLIACSHIIGKCLTRYYQEKGKRIDGRKMDELRDISYHLNPLTNASSSVLFARGNTQVLTTTTIGKNDEDIHEEDSYSRKIYAHYNFYGFANDEITKSYSLKRRELGHGYIIEHSVNSSIKERAIENNTLRISTDVLSSDGSTSIAGSMSAAIAVKALGLETETLAGIGIGCFSNKEDELVLMTDISGLEDEFSHFDAKILMNNNKNLVYIQIDSKKTVLNIDVLSRIVSLVEQKIDKYIEQINEPIKNMVFEKHKNISQVKALMLDSVSARFILKNVSLNSLQKQFNVKIDLHQNKLSIIGSEKDINNAAAPLLVAIQDSKNQAPVGPDFPPKIAKPHKTFK